MPTGIERIGNLNKYRVQFINRAFNVCRIIYKGITIVGNAATIYTIWYIFTGRESKLRIIMFGIIYFDNKQAYQKLIYLNG